MPLLTVFCILISFISKFDAQKKCGVENKVSPLRQSDPLYLIFKPIFLICFVDSGAIHQSNETGSFVVVGGSHGSFKESVPVKMLVTLKSDYPLPIDFCFNVIIIGVKFLPVKLVYIEC